MQKYISHEFLCPIMVFCFIYFARLKVTFLIKNKDENTHRYRVWGGKEKEIERGKERERERERKKKRSGEKKSSYYIF